MELLWRNKMLLLSLKNKIASVSFDLIKLLWRSTNIRRNIAKYCTGWIKRAMKVCLYCTQPITQWSHHRYQLGTCRPHLPKKAKCFMLEIFSQLAHRAFARICTIIAEVIFFFMLRWSKSTGYPMQSRVCVVSGDNSALLKLSVYRKGRTEICAIKTEEQVV